MELNHTPLSRNKMNRMAQSLNIPTKSIGNTTNIEQKISVQSNPGEILKEGKIVKGEVIDLRFQEVKLKIHPDNEVISAKISNESKLSIGQTAEFEVISNTSEQISLRMISANNTLYDSTIEKALIASQLPNTERNREIVGELLKQQLPIDKQTLLTMVRAISTNKEVSTATFVMMLKNQIPLTPSNVRQFLSHQQGAHQLLPNMNDFTGKVSNIILPTLRDSIPLDVTESLSRNGKETKQIPNENELSQPTLEKGESYLKESLSQLLDYSLRILSKDGPIKNLLSPQDFILLNEHMDQEIQLSHIVIPADIQSQIQSGDYPTSDFLALIKDLYGVNSMEELSTALSQSMIPADIQQIIIHLQQLTELNPTTYESLIKTLENTFGKQIDFPNLSQELLAHPDQLKELLTEGFLQRWSLTPKELLENAPAHKLYDRMEKDMEKLSSLLKFAQDTSGKEILKETITTQQEKMQFTRTLDDLFHYVQVPLRFQETEGHGELYVYHKTNKSQEDKENFSVLLNLDLTNLGSLNVHLVLTMNQIQATFFTGDEEVGSLLENHLTELKDQLSEKGYLLQSRVEYEIPEVEILKEVLDDDTIDGTLHRYSFDIRA